MKIRIGSRDSRLAVIQSEIVMGHIQKAQPGCEIELITMKTTGDMILDQTLDKIGGKGLFVKELDQALLRDEVDLTVHSYKDLPMEGDPLLPVIAVSRREDPRDVLVLPSGCHELDLSRPIGCSSARRRIQIERLFPGCQVQPVRGNVLTRLAKLDSGLYGGLILASAGLRRLGLEHRISRCFSPEEILPSAAQGILAVQARAGFDGSVLGDFHDVDAWDISLAERSFVRALGGGCSSPVAAYGELEGGSIRLKGLYVDEMTGEVRKGLTQGLRSNAVELGQALAACLKEGGGECV